MAFFSSGSVAASIFMHLPHVSGWSQNINMQPHEWHCIVEASKRSSKPAKYARDRYLAQSSFDVDCKLTLIHSNPVAEQHSLKHQTRCVMHKH
jgi:hypothetical protein